MFVLYKFIGRYFKEIFQNKTGEEVFRSVWYEKGKLNSQQLLRLISDRAHLLKDIKF